MKRLSKSSSNPLPKKKALPLKNRRKQQKLSINYPQLSISIIYPRKKVSTPQQKITCNALGLDLDLRLEGPHREAKQLVRLMDRNPVIVDNYTSIVTNDYHTNNRLIGLMIIIPIISNNYIPL